MLKSQIARDEMDQWTALVRQEFGLSVLEEGLEFQQKGMVYNAALEHGRRLTAKVQTPEGVRSVSLDLDFLAISSCSCEAAEYCAHMAAVFLYAYASYGHPDQFVKQLRWEAHSKPHPRYAASAASVPTAGTQRKPDRPRVPDAYPPEWAAVPPESWEALLRERAEAFSRQHGNPRGFSGRSYYPRLQEFLVRPASLWPEPARRMFQFESYVSVLEMLERAIDRAAPYEAPILRAIGLDLMEAAAGLLDELAGEPLDGIAGPVERLQDRLRSFALSADPLQLPWHGLYLRAWQTVWNVPHRVETELLRLNARPDPGSARWTLAHATVLQLLGRDAEALAELGRFSKIDMDLMQPFLWHLQQAANWERLLAWVRWSAERVDFRLPWSLRWVQAYWAACAEHLPCADEWLAFLARHRPAGDLLYLEALLQLERYREWAGFHMAQRLSPGDADRAAFRLVESCEPEALLPWLHQEIERCILQKHRSAYKAAIRWLKRLKTLYKKCKRSDAFDAYLARLSDRFARLRAFQEELRKGKLIG